MIVCCLYGLSSSTCSPKRPLTSKHKSSAPGRGHALDRNPDANYRRCGNCNHDLYRATRLSSTSARRSRHPARRSPRTPPPPPNDGDSYDRRWRATDNVSSFAPLRRERAIGYGFLETSMEERPLLGLKGAAAVRLKATTLVRAVVESERKTPGYFALDPLKNGPPRLTKVAAGH